jgi:hypothetical protein
MNKYINIYSLYRDKKEEKEGREREERNGRIKGVGNRAEIMRGIKPK